MMIEGTIPVWEQILMIPVGLMLCGATVWILFHVADQVKDIIKDWNK